MDQSAITGNEKFIVKHRKTNTKSCEVVTMGFTKLFCLVGEENV